FDRVLLMFTSFGYFEDAENEAVIKAILRALKPGGMMLLDTLNRDTVLKGLPPEQVIEKNDDLLINRFSFDSQRSRLINRRVVIRNGIRKEKPFSIRVYSPIELSDMLRRLNVTDYQMVDENSLPISSESRKIIVIAKKP
ncbi:MAG: class I SAM-dependent methyltransferase, partial [Anaerolineaceae bacterium]|nr:class I SAM-dependent methyltransferase [Anaerolineaceae bacterium]